MSLPAARSKCIIFGFFNRSSLSSEFAFLSDLSSLLSVAAKSKACIPFELFVSFGLSRPLNRQCVPPNSAGAFYLSRLPDLSLSLDFLLSRDFLLSFDLRLSLDLRLFSFFLWSFSFAFSSFLSDFVSLDDFPLDDLPLEAFTFSSDLRFSLVLSFFLSLRSADFDLPRLLLLCFFF